MVATGQFTWSLPDGTVTQIVRWQAEPAQLTEELLEPVEADERMRNRVAYPGLPDSQIEQITQEDMAPSQAERTAQVARDEMACEANFRDLSPQISAMSYSGPVDAHGSAAKTKGQGGGATRSRSVRSCATR